MTDMATILACSLVSAPVTTHSRSLVAPSPSPAIYRERFISTTYRALTKVSKSPFWLSIRAFPA